MRLQRVLLVDDNPRNLFIMEKILGDAYLHSSTTSGEEALEIAASFRPDLILLDIMMPGIDGYETCRRLRAGRIAGFPKVIMVSARAMTRERLEGYQAGADDYLTKPFSADELLAKVRVYSRLKSVEEVEQMRGALITLLRHETQTPISIIAGALELLSSGDSMTARQSELVEMAHQASGRLRRLIDRTVMLNNLRTGRSEGAPAPTLLETVIRDRLNAVQEAIRTRGLSLEAELDAQTIVEVDGRFVQNTFGEIFENALAATPAGGRIRVVVSRNGGVAEIMVENEGPMPDAEMLREAFTPFWVKDLDHHSEGHGLGLAIAMESAVQNGGDLRAEADPSGVRFIIRVPLQASGGERRLVA